MAARPVKGNFPHGSSFRQGLVKVSNASGRIWINPVDKITPAAKALIKKNRLLPGVRAGTFLPAMGRDTPIALEMRMAIMAPILYLIVMVFGSWVRSSASQVHSPATWVVSGRSTRRGNKME